jgi:hypothetical protein
MATKKGNERGIWAVWAYGLLIFSNPFLAVYWGLRLSGY